MFFSWVDFDCSIDKSKYPHFDLIFTGEVGRMYEANVDDVGYRLVAIYTPVREDGVEGQPVSVSTEPITVGNFSNVL
jgi:hypothetical protein